MFTLDKPDPVNPLLLHDEPIYYDEKIKYKAYLEISPLHDLKNLFIKS